ncbi:MAG: hypothetical protein EOO31_01120 [Comamonadaceae bacterium]|nr:MAG: hypothetical protein EOO31_01120 [Comamonadaceae bacterium]
MPHPASASWAAGVQKAHTFQPDWENYVTTKVRLVRAVLLPGIDTFTDGDLQVPMATGFIELSGMRAGPYRTLLKIGFTDAGRLILPTFQVVDNVAIGTLVMSSLCFSSALQFAHSSMAHFRIGGDGRRNALATDSALLDTLAMDMQ